MTRSLLIYFRCQRKGKKSHRIVISTASLIPQLKRILLNNLNHFSQSQNCPTDRGDLKQFPKFRNHTNNVKFNLIVNTSGTSPKADCHSTFWTVYFSIVELSGDQRGNRRNTAVTTVIAGAQKPTSRIWEFALLDLEKEIQLLRTEGIAIAGTRFFLANICGSINLDVGICVLSSSDLSFQVQCSIFNISNWNSLDHGCGHCLAKPETKGRKRVWPLTGTYARRNHATFLEDARNHRNGLHGVQPWMKILLPMDCRIDALSVLEEGLLRQILDIYFTPDTIQKFAPFYRTAKFPARGPLLPRSLKKFACFNGGDKRTVSFLF